MEKKGLGKVLGETEAAPQIIRDRLFRTASRQDLWERSISIIKGSKFIVEHAKNFKLVLGTSKGRDKICSLIQYSAKLVYTCNIYSNIKAVQDQLELFGEKRDDELLSARIYRTMSRNRKIFKLFKFIDEIYYIMSIAKSESTAIEVKFFDIMAHACSFMNFLLDNFIWMINTRILGSDYLHSQVDTLQYYRYLAALWRNIFNLVYTIQQLRICDK